MKIQVLSFDWPFKGLSSPVARRFVHSHDTLGRLSCRSRYRRFWVKNYALNSFSTFVVDWVWSMVLQKFLILVWLCHQIIVGNKPLNCWIFHHHHHFLHLLLLCLPFLSLICLYLSFTPLFIFKSLPSRDPASGDHLPFFFLDTRASTRIRSMQSSATTEVQLIVGWPKVIGIVYCAQPMMER